MTRRPDRSKARRAAARPNRRPVGAAPAQELQELLEAALAQHRAGRLQEADRLYRAFLERQPEHPEALHLLGILAHQLGRSEEAEPLVRRAIDGNPEVPAYHDTLGTVLAGLGQKEAAVAAHRDAMSLAPQRPATLFNLANALEAAGRPLEAVQRYREALAQQPTHAKARFNLANTLRDLGHEDEAERHYRTVIAEAPELSGACTNLAGLLSARGRGDEAVALYRSALRHRPNDARAHFNLGAALQALDRYEEAELCYRAALRLAPDFVEALDNLGSVLLKLKAGRQAVACHREALRRAPTSARARIFHNLGNALKAVSAFQEAEATFAAAVELEPGLADAGFNLGLLQLARGELAEGWRQYDWRFASGNAIPDRRFAVPCWEGPADARNGPVLIWREQGVGDEVLFASCYADAIGAGATLRIECEARLATILRRCLPDLPGEAIQPESRDVEAGTVPVDREIPAGTLPRLFRTSLSAFPLRSSFLAPDPAALALWRGRLADLGPGLRVGVCWRSGLIDDDRARNYTVLADWQPVLAVPGVVFVNLQYDAEEAELAEAAATLPAPLVRWPEVDLKHDLEAFLALVACLDLVITAPTAVGEIAAAAGVPTWRFSTPDDWSKLGTRVRPWYTAMRVFHPRRGQAVPTVLRQIAHALRRAGAAAVVADPPQATQPEPGDGRTDMPIGIDQALEQAMAAHRAGRLATAAAGYRSVLRLAPDHPDGLNLLGVLLYQQDRPEQAEPTLRRAVAAAPDLAEAWHHLGLALQAVRRPGAAILCLERALRLRPAFAEALTHLGRLRQGQGDRLETVRRLQERALALDPALPDAHTNLGFLFEDQAHFAAAEACYRRVVTLRPTLAEAHNNLGMAVQSQNRPALAHFQRALALDPHHALAHWNRGLVLLSEGDLATGWADYDWRFRARQLQKGRSLPLPVWRGEPLRGGRLMIWGEQGLGDELLFASCYRDLAPVDGPVLAEANPKLVPLLRRSFPHWRVRADSSDAEGRETGVPPDADKQIAAGSLPRLVRTRLTDFPRQSAFLQTDPATAAQWRTRVAALGPGLKLGLCWQSQLRTARRRGSYTSLADWAPVLDLPGCHFVNLQYGDCEAELRDVETRLGCWLARWDDLDLKDDLDGVAALMQALDLVITAPTVVGELAGALGVPVWRVMAPEDDWTGLGTRVRPWFPSQRLFRPRTGERLADAMPAHVARALRRLLRPAAAPAAAPPAPAPWERPPATPKVDAATLEAWLSEGARLHQAGQGEAALGWYRRVLAADPKQPVALHLTGVLAQQQGNHAAAVEWIGQAVAVAPGYAAALLNLGNSLQALDRFEEAGTAYQQALRLRPQAAEAWTNLGNVLDALGRLDAAAAVHRRALALAPDLGAAHSNLAAVLWQCEDLARAEAAARRGVRLAPEQANGHVNLGTVLREQGRLPEAAASYRAALRLDDRCAEAYSDLGRLSALAGKPDEAEALYRQALALVPELPSARFNWGLLCLAAGRLAEGWAGYDARFRSRQVVARWRPLARPVWQGEPLDGARILVWPEQGLGDELLFATLYPALLAQARAGLIEADARLVSLLARSLPGAEVSAVDRVRLAEQPVDPNRFDRHCPAGSLARHLRPRLSAWSPEAPAALLRPDPARLAEARVRLAPLKARLRVGICWRSSRVTAERAGCYTTLEAWDGLLRLPEVAVVTLQYDASEAELHRAEVRTGGSIARWPDLDLKHDLEGVAALIACLDLVISAPTAVSELAGALGTPVWRLSPATDWTHLGTGCRPWFPAQHPLWPGRTGSAAAAVALAIRRLQGLRERAGR